MADATHPVETIARLLMLTTRRIQQMTRDGHLPKTERGRYELVPVVQAYIRYLRERSVRGDAADTDAYGAHRTRLVKAQADVAELDSAIRRGELVRRDQVLSAWQAVVANARAKMLSLPIKSAVRVISADRIQDVEAILRDDVYEILSELGQYDGLPARGARADVETPAEPNGEPVGGPLPNAKPRKQRRARAVEDVEGSVPARDHGRDQRPAGRDGRGDVKRSGRKDGGGAKRGRVSRASGSRSDPLRNADARDGGGVQQRSSSANGA